MSALTDLMSVIIIYYIYPIHFLVGQSIFIALLNAHSDQLHARTREVSTN